MWPNPLETADLVAFTEEILNEKLHFLCSVHKINTKESVGVTVTWVTYKLFGILQKNCYESYSVWYVRQFNSFMTEVPTV